MSRNLVSALVHHTILAAALTATLAACGQKDARSDMPPLPASATAPITYVRDIHSYAQPQIARVRHIDPHRQWLIVE